MRRHREVRFPRGTGSSPAPSCAPFVCLTVYVQDAPQPGPLAVVLTGGQAGSTVRVAGAPEAPAQEAGQGVHRASTPTRLSLLPEEEGGRTDHSGSCYACTQCDLSCTVALLVGLIDSTSGVPISGGAATARKAVTRGHTADNLGLGPAVSSEPHGQGRH